MARGYAARIFFCFRVRACGVATRPGLSCDPMPLFTDADEVYATIGKLFEDIAAEEEMSAKLHRVNTTVRYEYTNPEAAITMKMVDGEAAEVAFGDTGLEPEVTMSMEADTAHRFWLGEVNVTVALARGEIKASGPVTKILKLVPLAKPFFPRYRAQLEAQGRGDLIAAEPSS